MAQTVGQPLGVLDIGFAPRHVFDVLGIDQQELKLAFQDVVYRLPKLTGAL